MSSIVTNIDLSSYKKEEQSEKNKLPAGMYICVIKHAEIDEVEKGMRLKLFIDIATGEYKGYFSRLEQERGVWSYNAIFTRYIVKEGLVQTAFMNVMRDLEASNPTFVYKALSFSAEQLEGLYCGFTFDKEEYTDKFGTLRTAIKVKFSKTVKQVKESAKKQEAKKPEIPEVPVEDEDVPF